MKQRGQEKAVLFVLFYVFVCIVPVNGIRVSSQEGQGRGRGKCTVYIDILYYIVGRVSGECGGMVYIFPVDQQGRFGYVTKKFIQTFQAFNRSA